jgi:CHAT domain-containing protein
MRSHLITSALTIALGLATPIVSASAFPEMAVAQTVDQRKVEADRFLQQGIQQYQVSQFEAALQSWQQSLKLYREIKNRLGEGNALGGLGIAYKSLGNYPKAIEFQEQSLAIAREIKDRLGEGNALGNLGIAYRNLGNYPKAIEFYEQLLAIAREIKDRLGEGGALGNLGIAYYSLGNYPKAIDYQEQYLAIAREIKDRLGEGNALGGLGIAYYSLGNYPKAIEYHEQLLAIAQQIKDRQGERLAFNNIAATLKKQNQTDLAIVFYKQSINVSEAIRKDNRPLSRDLQASYTETVAGTYRNLADLLLSQGRIGEAQKVLELLKVQELNDITEGSRSPSPQQNQVALSKVEEQIIQKHTSLIQFGQLLSECKRDTCAKLEEYKTTHRKLTEAYDKFIEDLKTQLVADRDRSIAATTDDFIGGASKIVNTQPNTVLIYPLVLKDKTRILWASKGGILSQAECPLGEADLSKLIKQFRDDLQNNSDLNPVQKTGQKLYECLLPKTLRNELTKNKIDNLVFVPDRVTNYIPMAALYDGKNYLIESFAVSNILSVGLTDTKDKLPDRPSVLGFGLSNSVTLSNPTRNFSSLPFVPIELEGIVKKANASSDSRGVFTGTTWLDRDFSRSNLETKVAVNKLLHIFRVN